MKYYAYKNKAASNLYTYRWIDYMIDKYHTASSPSDCDFVLFSICDITEISALVNLRASTNKKIIVGGHLASIACALLGMFSDYIICGHGFEFFKLQTEEAIRASKYAYFAGKEATVEPSAVVDFKDCPTIQINKGLYSTVSGVGCKNKCSFCVTSWTNPHVSRSEIQCRMIKQKIDKLKTKIKFISNDYVLGSDGQMVQDYLVKDFVRLTEKPAPKVRCGIEFATEATRQKHGKPITDKQIEDLYRLSKDLNIKMFLFHIAGLNTMDEWVAYFDSIETDYSVKPPLVLKFTNLEYQQGTPLFKKRFDIDIKKYMDGDALLRLWRKANIRNKRLRTLPCKYPAHALWRTGMSLCISPQQFDIFYKLRNCKDVGVVYGWLMSSGVMDTDYQLNGVVDYRQIHKL